MTLLLTVASLFFGVLIGLVLALIQESGTRVGRVVTLVYLWLFRGTPVLFQIIFVYNVLPSFGIRLSAFVSAVLALSLNEGAYMAEILRSGLQAVTRGQRTAGLALGMTTGQMMRYVVIPQAARIVIPPVTNDFIALFKDTSVCSVILITELTRKYNELYNFHREYIIQLAFITAGLYLVMSYPLALVARVLEKRFGSAGGAHR